jgi:subtilisin family serine protease
MICNDPGIFVGTAPDVDLMFALTDDLTTETPQDEFNYVAALEWADSLGADIVSASLSYKDFDPPFADYSFSQMDGKTTISTKGAVIAARKGLLIVNAAGNSGFLCAPCDADSVLCVGGADSLRNYDLMSSYGPTFDGRVKPDVAAQTKHPYYKSVFWNIFLNPFYSGTSIAAPQISGLAACLKQAHPNATNIQLINAIRQSAHRYNNPDAGTGYGVPNGRVADSLLDVMLNVKEASTVIKNVSVYPNPANDFVNIEADEMISVAEIRSLDGKLLMSERLDAKKGIMNIQALSPGFYLMQLRSASNAISHSKLVKQ